MYVFQQNSHGLNIGMIFFLFHMRDSNDTVARRYISNDLAVVLKGAQACMAATGAMVFRLAVRTEVLSRRTMCKSVHCGRGKDGYHPTALRPTSTQTRRWYYYVATDQSRDFSVSITGEWTVLCFPRCPVLPQEIVRAPPPAPGSDRCGALGWTAA
jgi:hypothetical protein